MRFLQPPVLLGAFVEKKKPFERQRSSEKSSELPVLLNLL